MNIQYENQEENSLLGSYKQKYDPAYYSIPKQQIIHKVVYGDTLEGLSLTYNISIAKIKQRNKIESDEIYYLKQIVIPDPQNETNQKQQQQQFMKIQEFMCYMSTNQKSNKTARYYLSENQWDVQKAVKEYRDDLEWQKKNAIKPKYIANIKNKNEDTQTHNQTEIQMINKKNQ